MRISGARGSFGSIKYINTRNDLAMISSIDRQKTVSSFTSKQSEMRLTIIAAGLEKCNCNCAGENSFRTPCKDDRMVRIILVSMSKWFDTALFRNRMIHSRNSFVREGNLWVAEGNDQQVY